MINGGRLESRLGEISEFITKGATPTTYGYEWQASGVPFLRSECVSARGLVLDQAMFISEVAHRALRRSQVLDGDILMTITGNVGRVVRLHGLGAANINQHIARIRVRDPLFDSRFVFHYLAQPEMRRRYESITTGQAYPQISLTQVRDTPLIAPPIEDQREVADVLDNADDVVLELERLIAKKQAVKQGMMQQLLTGKTRLPGFNGEWTAVRAGEIGSFKGGSGFPLRYQGRSHGDYPFFKVSDMSDQGNELFMRSARHYIDEDTRRRMGAIVIPEESIVFAKVGGAIFLERKRILRQPSCIDNNMAAMLVEPKRADIRFVHHVLTTFALASLAATTALPSLNGSQLRSIPIRLPIDIAEQKAIAAVLNDGDDELKGLSVRLDKARQIKQGMMQELLMGRTRLTSTQCTP